MNRRSALALLAGAMIVSCTRSRARSGPPERVVSLTPSTTEAMHAIGAGALLVGRSKFCDYPLEVKSLPVVGGYVDPNFEAILALKPDLVIGARGPAGAVITEKLERVGVATYFPPTETLAEIEQMIVGLGARTAHDEGGQRAALRVRERIADVERAVAGRRKPRVLLVFGLEPIAVAGPGGFPDEMLKRAGAENVVTAGGSYPTLGMERVMVLDPEVVLNAAIAEAHGAERIKPDTPGWSSVRAVKAGRIVPITDEAVLRPGPRVGDGLAVLARAIHADLALP